MRFASATRTLLRTLTVASIAATATACSVGGSTPAAAPSPSPSASPAVTVPVDQATFKSGLRCTTIDDFETGGVDCGWETFTVPKDILDRTGQIEELRTDSGFLELTRTEFSNSDDYQMCVTFNGGLFEALSCSFVDNSEASTK